LPYLEAIDFLSSDRKLYQEGIAGGERLFPVSSWLARKKMSGLNKTKWWILAG
jgi:hypothetical protein